MHCAILVGAKSWLGEHLAPLHQALVDRGHDVVCVQRHEDIPVGLDVVFMLSYPRIVPAEFLARTPHNLVVHQSDLPHGRGWSPLAWQILEGKREIPIVLFAASVEVDRGPIYARRVMKTSGRELLPELRDMQIAETFALCLDFVDGYPGILAQGQLPNGAGSWYDRRGPADSRLDPDKTIAEQFDLLRTVDNDAYPAFFTLRGRTYRLRIDPADSEPTP
ncbi:MAG: formyltransferase family protein [Planctomycetota bacterium]